jgi:hypothetical protein
MKKIIFLVVAAITIVSAANEAEEFFYNRGYEAGYNAGYEEGIKAMQIEAKKILDKYTDDIKAYEIGKYLIKEKKITAPKIYQERAPDGTVKIVVIKSEILDELSIEDIFSKYGNIPAKNYNSQAQNNDVRLNSVYLANRDNSVAAIPAAADRDKAITTLSLKKTWKNKDILQKANLVYSEDDNFYKVIFFTSKEKSDFCKNFGVCK